MNGRGVDLADGPAFDSRATWTRQPQQVLWDGHALSWTCHPITEFWREGDGSYCPHDGSAYLQPVNGDFELHAQLTGRLTRPLDQVGVFVERNAQAWLKAGLELDDDLLWLSAVHTQHASDQSRERWPGGASISLRVARSRGHLTVACVTAEGWHVFRSVHCPGPLGVGVYSCAPRGDAFDASAMAITLR